MNRFNPSLLVLGLAAAFAAPIAHAGETSLNGWGKAYADAAVRAAERPPISLFQNPGALVERPVVAERPVLLDRPVLVERPTIIRPERIASILR